MIELRLSGSPPVLDSLFIRPNRRRLPGIPMALWICHRPITLRTCFESSNGNLNLFGNIRGNCKGELDNSRVGRSFDTSDLWQLIRHKRVHRDLRLQERAAIV
jgi:hypothetical protein